MPIHVSKALKGFDEYLIARVEQAGDQGVPQSDAFRPWFSTASYPTLKYRAERLQRQGKIRSKRIGRTVVLLPAGATSKTEEGVTVE
jgi:hypothetical protein